MKKPIDHVSRRLGRRLQAVEFKELPTQKTNGDCIGDDVRYQPEHDLQRYGESDIEKHHPTLTELVRDVCEEDPSEGEPGPEPRGHIAYFLGVSVPDGDEELDQPAWVLRY